MFNAPYWAKPILRHDSQTGPYGTSLVAFALVRAGRLRATAFVEGKAITPPAVVAAIGGSPIRSFDDTPPLIEAIVTAVTTMQHDRSAARVAGDVGRALWNDFPMTIERLEPTPNEHPVFEKPPPGATLWRYMDFPRFIALLERRALFFSPISSFSDPFEGALTQSLLAQIEALGENQLEERRSWRTATYVNCWNEDEGESVALWSLYTSRSGGVAIKSSVASILSALEKDTGLQQDELYIGRVRYVDYNIAVIPDDNALWPVVHKRFQYRFEHEVRLVIWARHVVWAAQELAQREGRRWPEVLPELAPTGFDVAIDPNTLIEAVVLAPEAPDWLLTLVRAVSARYGLTAPIARSDLDAQPV